VDEMDNGHGTEALEQLRNMSGSCPKADLIASHPLRRQTIFAILLMDSQIEFHYHVVCFSAIVLHYPRIPSTLDAPRTLLVAGYHKERSKEP